MKKFTITLIVTAALAAMSVAQINEWSTTGAPQMSAHLRAVLPNGQTETLGPDYTGQRPIVAQAWKGYRSFRLYAEAEISDQRLTRDQAEDRKFILRLPKKGMDGNVLTDRQGRVIVEELQAVTDTDGKYYWELSQRDLPKESGIARLPYEAFFKAGRNYTKVNLFFGLGPTFASNGTGRGAYGLYVHQVQYPWCDDLSLDRYFEWVRQLNRWMSDFGRTPDFTPDAVVKTVEEQLLLGNAADRLANQRHAGGTMGADDEAANRTHREEVNTSVQITVTKTEKVITFNVEADRPVRVFIKTRDNLSQYPALREHCDDQNRRLGYYLELRPGQGLDLKGSMRQYADLISFEVKDGNDQWVPVRRGSNQE